ncbi:AT-hook motif nuclear-localized protein 28 [Ricinus communis]|uniref:DNA binding protein, putative n=1 Tax=Ricinus communis TaxID=3988 RepID=B9RJW1_RICCO|nr:AT-hook motif nuclear-localized protein 28 [Ricinus communis]EEF48613.1 DNA binding protein, putative [Ricinus communis]|eukprot:XP_002514030.1 AT-hook motif nuclear-localized protein 28 [Ricinus communis]
MKGEYVDQQHHHHHHPKHESTNMFSKLHHHHHPLPFSTHFQLSRDSEDDDTRSTGAATTAITTATATATTTTPTRPTEPPNSSGGTDGATIEVVRRPRGRPPGSKNKPKPPVIITRDPEPAMSPYILEVCGGSDVVEAISRFCRRKNIGICVLTGSGTVANVTLRQPSTTPGSTITFHGRFDILSISATFMPQTVSYPVPNTFTISLAGPQGQIVGGLVAGSLIAAGTVYIMAATFNNPSYHRLPVDDEGRNSGSGGGGGEGQSPAVSGAGGGGDSGGGGGDSGGGMVMYSGHLPSDVIWAPTARPPPPY